MRHIFSNVAIVSIVATIGIAAIPAPGRAAMTADGAAVEIRRTTDGIPHIRAGTWRGLGYGYGYAQAQDALCSLAEGFVSYSGRRSYFFGAAQRPQAASTFGKATNLETDFFFKAFADDQAVNAYRRRQPADLRQLVAGYAAGYNRYLRHLARDKSGTATHACAAAPWLRPITPDDLYRRMIAAGYAGGYAHFIAAIVNARPNAPAWLAPAPDTLSTADPIDPVDMLSLKSRLAMPVGESEGLGSNALAFGHLATGGQGSVLFGNPHWYWSGPDRFYQAHLTLPGKLDVAGVSFLGIPVIMIGFNHNVAWTHTVSSARRFGLFELSLDPKDPTRYMVDGVSEPMQQVMVTVETRRADGTLETVRRTLYRTRYGPIADLGMYDTAFGWGSQHALAMRDINAGNPRIFRNFLRWNGAGSLGEFMAIQRQEAAMPWVNTVAIGRNEGRVWYGDVGAMPDVPDDLRAACATPLSKAFAGLDPVTPLLDGSRSACDWKTGPNAMQAGALAAARMPGLLRADYVANMNNSYWLSNPAQPLEGYPLAMGGERTPLSLRAREGHRIAAELVAEGQTSASGLASRLMQEVLGAHAYSADRYKSALLEGACVADNVVLADGLAVDMRQACDILRQWPGRAGVEDRGVMLWDAFWARLEKIPVSVLYTVPFSADAPLQTPRAPNASDPRVAQALAGAVDDLARLGQPLDAPLGERRYVRSEGRRVPLFGGCDAAGYFTVTCIDGGEYSTVKTAASNSYLQVVYFTAGGVQAYTLLAHGELETAIDDGPGAGPVKRYAEKGWLRLPFHERDVARDLALTRLVLRP